MPAPIGPRPISTITSPGSNRPLALPLDGARSHRRLAREDTRRAGLAIDAVGIDHARIDRRALDDRAFRRQVAARKRDRAGQAALGGQFGRHDDVVGIDAVALAQHVAQALAPLASVSHQSSTRAERAPADGHAVEIEQIQLAQMQHDLGHAAGQEHAHRRMSDRAVGQRIDQARHAAIDVDPVLDGRPPQAGGIGDGRNVQQQVRRAAEGRMHDHRVADRGVGQNVAQW